MAQPSKSVSKYLRSEIERGAFPGAQYAVGEGRRIVAEDAIGSAVIEPEPIAATLDTIYDLASLTKPLVTTLLSVMLAERGLIALDAAVGTYLEEIDNGPARRITLTQLLTHTSGLPSWQPLYIEADGPAQVIAAVARMPVDSDAAPRVVYSDPNYILLACALERVTGERLDRLAHREIFEPLSLRRTMFNPPREMRREIAATEHGQEFERKNVEEYLEMKRANNGSLSKGLPQAHPQVKWRTDLIWGEVHDGNAHFLGGVAGHAGLFSTAREVWRIASQFLPGSQLVNNDSLKLFTENFTGNRGTARSIGWVLAPTPDCSAGPALPLSAFGHTGFTGTSVWIDPEKQRTFVLLTNRIHPNVGEIQMKEPRQQFHTLAVAHLDRLGNEM